MFLRSANVVVRNVVGLLYTIIIIITRIWKGSAIIVRVTWLNCQKIL